MSWSLLGSHRKSAEMKNSTEYKKAVNNIEALETNDACVGP
jgi:hypothetical protein